MPSPAATTLRRLAVAACFALLLLASVAEAQAPTAPAGGATTRGGAEGAEGEDAEQHAPPRRAEPSGPPEIPWAAKPPEIDGVVSPGEWDHALELSLLPSWSKEEPPDERFVDDVSAVRLLWDEKSLYVLLGSTRPPANDQAALVEARYKSLGGTGEAPEVEGNLIETFAFAWDPRPPSPFGMPPKIPGAFRIRLFLGLQDLGDGVTPLLFETQAGYRGASLPEGVAGDGWSPEFPLQGYALKGARAEMAIPFARLNGLYGSLAGSDGVRPARGIERFTPPLPGEEWEFRFERRHDAEHRSARGGAHPLFSLADDAETFGGGATLRFGAPPDDAPEQMGDLVAARHPLPSYFLDSYVRGARQASREGKPLVLLYTVGEIAAQDASRRLWEDRRVAALGSRAVFVWLNPRRLPESAPSFGVRHGLEVVVLMPSGRVAKRWRGLPGLEEFVAELDALCGPGAARR